MWFFKRAKEPKKPECLHKWVVTEVLLETNHYLRFKRQSQVARTCSLCLTQEHHFVAGHINHSTAYEIFGGRKNEND